MNRTLQSVKIKRSDSPKIKAGKSLRPATVRVPKGPKGGKPPRVSGARGGGNV